MIVAKTEAGHQALKERSAQLTPRQRSALIMFDGKRTFDEVRGSTGATQEDLDKLLELGMVYDPAPEKTRAEADAVKRAAEAVERHKHRTPQERYAEAYPIATQLTAGLGLRGFRLNLAVEAATSYEELVELAPKIREAVGPDKFAALENALNDR